MTQVRAYRWIQGFGWPLPDSFLSAWVLFHINFPPFFLLFFKAQTYVMSRAHV